MLDGGRLWALGCWYLLLDSASKYLSTKLTKAMELSSDGSKRLWGSSLSESTEYLDDKGLLLIFAGAVTFDGSATLKALNFSFVQQEVKMIHALLFHCYSNDEYSSSTISWS